MWHGKCAAESMVFSWICLNSLGDAVDSIVCVLCFGVLSRLMVSYWVLVRDKTGHDGLWKQVAFIALR